MCKISALSGIDRMRLEALAQSSKSQQLAQRCLFILASADSNKSTAAIAREFDTSPATVRLWQKRFSESGVDGLLDRPRTGAPIQIDDKTRAKILRLAAAGLSTRQIAARTKASQTSVARIIREEKTGEKQSETNPDTATLQQLTISLFHSLAAEVPFADFLKDLELATNSDHVVFLTFPSANWRPSLILSEGQPLEGTLPYLEKHYQKEILTDIPIGKLVTISELVSTEEFRSTELYRDYLSRYGIAHVMGLNIGSVRGITGGLRLARREEKGDFGPRERALCESLIPYLDAAFDLFVQRSDMEAEKNALSHTISGMSVGSIMVDPDAHILEANPPARAMLEMRDGLMLSGNRIALHNPRQSQQLQRLIHQNAMASIDPKVSGQTKAMRIDRPSDKEALSLMVRPAFIRSDNRLTVRPTTILHIVDPAQQRSTTANALSELFDLTSAETKVAIALTNGLTLQEAAQANGTSKNTVRSQLQSIFSKMGVNRQAQLIRTTLISVGLFSLQGE